MEVEARLGEMFLPLLLHFEPPDCGEQFMRHVAEHKVHSDRARKRLAQLVQHSILFGIVAVDALPDIACRALLASVVLWCVGDAFTTLGQDVMFAHRWQLVIIVSILLLLLYGATILTV